MSTFSWAGGIAAVACGNAEQLANVASGAAALPIELVKSRQLGQRKDTCVLTRLQPGFRGAKPGCNLVDWVAP